MDADFFKKFLPDASIQAYAHQPLVLLALFFTASFFMIWRLQAMEAKGFEGTVLGTLIMPYCSGFPNLVFAFVMSRSASNGGLVIENCLVNNVTNLTLIVGACALMAPAAKGDPKRGTAGKGKGKVTTKVYSKGGAPSVMQRIGELEVLFSLIALFLFTGTLWALAKDGVVSFYDGLVLIGLFLFWQVLHVFEILKDKIRKNKTFQWTIVLDLMVIAASAYGIYYATDELVAWVSGAGSQYISVAKLGWVSGLMMVLPNALIALYFARRGRQDVVLSSQVGDAHICIPMCIGIYAVFHAIHIPAMFQTAVYIILGAGVLHFLSVAFLKRVPQALGLGLLGAYAFFLYTGIVH